MMSGVVNAPSPFAGSASVAFSGSVPEKTQVRMKNYNNFRHIQKAISGIIFVILQIATVMIIHA